MTWDGAAGPVAGYYVIVSRNGGEPSVYSWSDDTLESIDAAFGDTIVVQVAAYDAAAGGMTWNDGGG